MKKCIGCGKLLQNQDSKVLGYVEDLEKSYCKRCFRLINYNDLIVDTTKCLETKDVLKMLEKVECAFVFIVDVLNIDSSFKKEVMDFLKNKDVIIIFSKCDLLPKSLNYNLFIANLKEYVKKEFNKMNVLDIILSSKNDSNFKNIFEDVLKTFNIKKVCFIGNSNVGKSSLINKIIEKNMLTTSYFLNTTLDVNEIVLDNYVLLDSPGFIDDENAYMYLEKSEVKKIFIKKAIKPKVYQIYEKQSYFIDDIFRVDVLSDKKASVVFYMNNDLSIHRTNFYRADEYEKKHLKNIKMYKYRYFESKDKNFDLVIDGIGFISFHNISKINIKIHDKIGISLRKGMF